VAGAFSPSLARETLSASYPDSTHVTIYLLDPLRQILFSSGPLAAEKISSDHAGVTEALRGESGTTYIKQNSVEHVIAYSSIMPTEALITEEEWRWLQARLWRSHNWLLVIVPAFILALVALFVATRIVSRCKNWRLKPPRSPGRL
jgi:hypothetical protein